VPQTFSKLKVTSCLMLLGFFIFAIKCNNKKDLNFENINNAKATYVGIAKCSSCHADVYNTYIETGMGKSWGLANKAKSAGDFDPKHAIVHDLKTDFYYKPYWVQDSLHILEFKLDGTDTIHKRDETITYIVGSGQHTNSHIINTNGYLHQAPITFYTQTKKWDMAPGFEDVNTRFDRTIEVECINCHNGFPDHIAGSINKYKNIKLGIDCERCHGPGSLHVNGIENGELFDTAKKLDYRIVNPRRMTINQQNNLCERCHLQGVATLHDGKTFFDFEPSLTLSDSWDVYLPTYTSNKNMIMASHVERMKMSKCYTASNAMSCITCHNPHISVKSTPDMVYNNACKKCHEQKNNCTAALTLRNTNGDNCNKCHMKKNPSIDIPHVAIHDHKIVKNINAIEQETNNNFTGLKCYNNDNTTPLSRARGFLEFYERYTPNNNLLDSAYKYLMLDNKQDKLQYQDLIRYYFLQNNFEAIIQTAGKINAENIKDAFNAYRIGEAHSKLNNYPTANTFFKKATLLQPLNLAYQIKLANNYLDLNEIKKAEQTFNLVIKEDIKSADAHLGLGYIAMQKQDYNAAKKYIETSKILNPNNVQNLLNLCATYYNLNKKQNIHPVLKYILKIDPNNKQAIAMKMDLAK
jgi:Cytochrome c554 and c-prime/Tetratricopeptide repeat